MARGRGLTSPGNADGMDDALLPTSFPPAPLSEDMPPPEEGVRARGWKLLGDGPGKVEWSAGVMV